MLGHRLRICGTSAIGLSLITKFARPGVWNDLDLLEVGSGGLTPAEWQMHFAFWAAAKYVVIPQIDHVV